MPQRSLGMSSHGTRLIHILFVLITIVRECRLKSVLWIVLLLRALNAGLHKWIMFEVPESFIRSLHPCNGHVLIIRAKCPIEVHLEVSCRPLVHLRSCPLMFRSMNFLMMGKTLLVFWMSHLQEGVINLILILTLHRLCPILRLDRLSVHKPVLLRSGASIPCHKIDSGQLITRRLGLYSVNNGWGLPDTDSGHLIEILFQHVFLMNSFDEADHLKLLYLVEELGHLALPFLQLSHRWFLVKVALEAICYQQALRSSIAGIEGFFIWPLQTCPFL